MHAKAFFSIAVFVAMLGLSIAVPAQNCAPGIDPIQVVFSDASSNPGDSAEILVSIDSGNTQPSTVVLFVQYDPAKLEPYADFYEFTFNDAQGNLLTDSRGNTVFTRSIVRPESALNGLNKGIDTQVHDEGVLGIAIQGGNTRIPDGPLLTIAFRVRNAALVNDLLAINGLDATESFPLFNEATSEVSFVNSSAAFTAAGGQTQPICVVQADGSISVGCVPVAAQPQNVQATEGQPGAVMVSWTGTASAGAQYRVFRSLDTDFSNAKPVGTGWQSATVFADVTALVPAQAPGGCACNPDFINTTYYYWVKARTAQGCESIASTPPVAGYRGLSKAAAAGATTKFTVFPNAAMAGGSVAVAPQAQIAVRLDADETIAPESIIGEVSSASGLRARASAVPANDTGTGWWVYYNPVAPWQAGDEIHLHASARTASGGVVGPVLRVYTAAVSAESSGNLKRSGHVETRSSDALPWLAEGAGEVYVIGPEGVFATPLEVVLPLPYGLVARTARLHVYRDGEGERRWYDAAQVDGLLAGAPELARRDGREVMVFRFRHSAIVQLGAPLEDSMDAASLAPATGARGGAAFASLLLGVLTIAIFLGAHYRRGFHRTRG